MISLSDSFACLASAATEAGSSESGFLVLQIIGILMGALGLVFFLGAAVGLVRFPDFYACGGQGGYFVDYVDACRIWVGDHGGFFFGKLVVAYQNHGGGLVYLPD